MEILIWFVLFMFGGSALGVLVWYYTSLGNYDKEDES